MTGSYSIFIFVYFDTATFIALPGASMCSPVLHLRAVGRMVRKRPNSCCWYFRPISARALWGRGSFQRLCYRFAGERIARLCPHPRLQRRGGPVLGWFEVPNIFTWDWILAFAIFNLRTQLGPDGTYFRYGLILTCPASRRGFQS